MPKYRLKVWVEHADGQRLNFETDSPLTASEGWSSLMALDHVVEAAVQDVSKRAAGRAVETPYYIESPKIEQNDAVFAQIESEMGEIGANSSLLG